MSFYGQSALLLAALCLGMGLSTLARNPKNKLHLFYALWTVAIAGFGITGFLDAFVNSPSFHLAHLFFQGWLAPAGLALFRTLSRHRSKGSAWALDFTIGLALTLSFFVVTGFGSSDWIRFPLTLLPLMSIAHPIAVFGNEHKRRRMLSVTAASLMVLIVVFDFIPSARPVGPAILNLCLALFVFFLSQTIKKQRFLDFESILSRFLVLLAMALVLTGIYSLLFSYVENKPALFLLNSFLVSFLLLALLDPLRALVREITRRLLRRRFAKLSELLRDATAKLVSVVEERVLADQILLFLEQSIDPPRGAVFFLDQDGTRYRRLRAFSKDPEVRIPIEEMLPDHPLLDRALMLGRQGDVPILFEPMMAEEGERSASRRQRALSVTHSRAFQALESNLLIPMIDGGKLLGFVTLWIENPMEPWGGDLGFLEFIFPYFEQCARTFSGLAVYVRQREKERLAELGEMAAGLAHEIRNPLGAILGAAELLEIDPSRPEAKFIAIIQEESKRLNGVVREFLDYSRPMPSERKPVDLSMIAKNAIESIKPSIGNQQIEIQFHEPPTPIWAEGLASSLHQVAVNLLHNSLKALEKKGRGGRITVSVTPFGKGTPRPIRMDVEDNGPGISKEHMDKIFIPFFTTSPSGTGLGLSICQKIVEAHRGRIEVSSEEGRFARFSVILPGALGESG